MRVFWRPLVPGERDPELLWGSLLSASALIAAGWLIPDLPTPLCPLHTLTGLPCPTCGMTRASSALMHGHPVTALAWNPLMTLLMGGAALYAFYAAIVLTGKLPRLRWTSPSRTEAFGIRIFIVLLILANWAYLIWQGV